MLLDLDPDERRIFLTAASSPHGVYVKAKSPVASTYELLEVAGAVEELSSPTMGFRVFRATPISTISSAMPARRFIQ